MKLSFEQVQTAFHLPSEQAADALGVHHSRLKRACRALGIQRWPHRRLSSLKVLKECIVSDARLGRSEKQELQRRVDEEYEKIYQQPDHEMDPQIDRLRVTVWKSNHYMRNRAAKSTARPQAHRGNSMQLNEGHEADSEAGKVQRCAGEHLGEADAASSPTEVPHRRQRSLPKAASQALQARSPSASTDSEHHCHTATHPEPARTVTHIAAQGKPGQQLSTRNFEKQDNSRLTSHSLRPAGPTLAQTDKIKTVRYSHSHDQKPDYAAMDNVQGNYDKLQRASISSRPEDNDTPQAISAASSLLQSNTTASQHLYQLGGAGYLQLGKRPLPDDEAVLRDLALHDLESTLFDSKRSRLQLHPQRLLLNAQDSESNVLLQHLSASLQGLAEQQVAVTRPVRLPPSPSFNAGLHINSVHSYGSHHVVDADMPSAHDKAGQTLPPLMQTIAEYVAAQSSMAKAGGKYSDTAAHSHRALPPFVAQPASQPHGRPHSGRLQQSCGQGDIHALAGAKLGELDPDPPLNKRQRVSTQSDVTQVTVAGSNLAPILPLNLSALAASLSSDTHDRHDRPVRQRPSALVPSYDDTVAFDLQRSLDSAAEDDSLALLGLSQYLQAGSHRGANRGRWGTTSVHEEHHAQQQQTRVLSAQDVLQQRLEQQQACLFSLGASVAGSSHASAAGTALLHLQQQLENDPHVSLQRHGLGRGLLRDAEQQQQTDNRGRFDLASQSLADLQALLEQDNSSILLQALQVNMNGSPGKEHAALLQSVRIASPGLADSQPLMSPSNLQPYQPRAHPSSDSQDPGPERTTSALEALLHAAEQQQVEYHDSFATAETPAANASNHDMQLLLSLNKHPRAQHRLQTPLLVQRYHEGSRTGNHQELMHEDDLGHVSTTNVISKDEPSSKLCQLLHSQHASAIAMQRQSALPSHSRKLDISMLRNSVSGRTQPNASGRVGYNTSVVGGNECITGPHAMGSIRVADWLNQAITGRAGTAWLQGGAQQGSLDDTSETLTLNV